MIKNLNANRNLIKFREREREELRKKYYDLFYSKIKIEGDLTEQQKDYLIKSLFYRGTICILKSKVEKKPLLCPYAVSSWNNDDYPVNIEFINRRNIPGLFPNKMKGINLEDCVIGYARPCKRPIYEYVDHQIDKIVDLAVTIKINEFVQRLPLLVGVSPQEAHKFKTIIDSMWNGEIAIFAETEDLDHLRSMIQTPFNIDKLRAEKESIENELKTQLGIDNNNNIKKERMIVDEVNANNDEIASSSNVYLTPLQAFTKDIKEALGFNISISWDSPLAEGVERNDTEEYEEGEEND